MDPYTKPIADFVKLCWYPSWVG